MIDYSGKDLARAFRTVRKNTIQIANEIPEAQYGFRPSADSRSVAEVKPVCTLRAQRKSEGGGISY